MPIWISRFAGLALALLPVSACDEATGFCDLGAGRTPLTETELTPGGITIVAPAGYCIDRRSLRASGGGFATLARCDTLGVKGDYLAYDLAILTVTAQPASAETPAPTAQALATSAPNARVLSRRNRGGLALVRLRSPESRLPDVSPTHWRAAFRRGDHIVGLGLYAPEGSPLLRDPGAALLTNFANRIRPGPET